MINTTGADQNSYITVSEANALLLTMAASFLTGDDQLADEDARYLIEAANDLDCLWRWCGEPTDNAQPMAWPRKNCPKPGWQVPGEPGWSVPYNEADFLAYKMQWLSGSNASAQMLPSDTVPKSIKEAQALIAVLRKQGSNLIGDNWGDIQGTALGPVRTSYVNAIREAADIHKRTSQLGQFIGDGLLRVPNE